MKKKKPNNAVYAEYNLFDQRGNMTLHSKYKLPKQGKLGGGWVAFYKRSIRALIDECPNFSTMKVYMYIASKQTYQKCAIVKNTHIMKTLHMSSSTVFEALKWLRENDYLQRYEIDGNTGWLLNPSVTGCGGNSKKSKEKLWRLGIERRKAELEKSIEKRQALLETLDEMIMKTIQDEDDDEIFDDAKMIDEETGEIIVQGDDSEVYGEIATEMEDLYTVDERDDEGGSEG